MGSGLRFLHGYRLRGVQRHCLLHERCRGQFYYYHKGDGTAGRDPQLLRYGFRHLARRRCSFLRPTWYNGFTCAGVAYLRVRKRDLRRGVFWVQACVHLCTHRFCFHPLGGTRYHVFRLGLLCRGQRDGNSPCYLPWNYYGSLGVAPGCWFQLFSFLRAVPYNRHLPLKLETGMGGPHAGPF